MNRDIDNKHTYTLSSNARVLAFPFDHTPKMNEHQVPNHAHRLQHRVGHHLAMLARPWVHVRQ
jgi:hypothetical protein